MEILIPTTETIIDENITIFQRGLLVSILLVRDKNPKMTLGKLKAIVSFNKEVKDNLAILHKEGRIKWSGYSLYMRNREKTKVNPDIKTAIDFMNELYGRNFSPTSPATTQNLRNRLATNSLADVMRVISNRWEAWKDEVEMSKHLNPTTIFRPSKFEKYLEEALRTQRGSALLEAKRMNLEDGDILSHSHSEGIVKTEIYKVKEYTLKFGKRAGAGIPLSINGNSLRNLLRIQYNSPAKDKEYTYIK